MLNAIFMFKDGSPCPEAFVHVSCSIDVRNPRVSFLRWRGKAVLTFKHSLKSRPQRMHFTISTIKPSFFLGQALWNWVWSPVIYQWTHPSKSTARSNCPTMHCLGPNFNPAPTIRLLLCSPFLSNFFKEIANRTLTYSVIENHDPM